VQATFSAEVDARLEASSKADVIRCFLEGNSAGDPEVALRAGDAQWGAVDGYKRGRRFIRIFPKSGLVKVDNLISGSQDGDYGPDVKLNKLGEWRHKVKASGMPDELIRRASDVLANMGGRRTRPGGGSGTPDQQAAQIREWKRSPLPKSLRFAILVRDNYTCQYCGRKAPDVVLHVDHRTPASRQGPDSVENLLTACGDCNLGKATDSSLSREHAG
jgi:hypothetical protein